MYISTRSSLKQATIQNSVLRELVQKGLISEPDLERQGGVDLVDHRLALPEHIIESILANARKADEDERLVVLDSWDAFAKMLESDRQAENRAINARNFRGERN